jgi:hypothetical protein
MFSATNPQDIELDNVLIGISLVLIPMSFGLLVTTYRRLPGVASPPLLLAQTV